jgi:hypothetical protein
MDLSWETLTGESLAPLMHQSELLLPLLPQERLVGGLSLSISQTRPIELQY